MNHCEIFDECCWQSFDIMGVPRRKILFYVLLKQFFLQGRPVFSHISSPKNVFLIYFVMDVIFIDHFNSRETFHFLLLYFVLIDHFLTIASSHVVKYTCTRAIIQDNVEPTLNNKTAFLTLHYFNFTTTVGRQGIQVWQYFVCSPPSR